MNTIEIILTILGTGFLLWLWFFSIVLYKSKKVNKPKEEEEISNFSKTQKLTYVVVFLWIIYGVVAILENMPLEQLAGYYASLTLFISTYLWGEFRRSSNKTDVFSPGVNSSRETLIYVVLLLWCILGAFGIFILDELNSLTVYFGSLSPFVMSYIIYKTTKGYEHIPTVDEAKMDNMKQQNENKYENEPGYYDDVDV